MLRSLLVSLLLSLAAQAAPMDALPPDPPGQVCDRFYDALQLGGKEYPLYGVFQRSGTKATVTLYAGKLSEAGAEWRKLYVWNVEGQSARSVLRAAVNGNDEIQFYFTENFKYVEARASHVLHYYPKTKKFEPQLAD